jgi:hypothetical protein
MKTVKELTIAVKLFPCTKWEYAAFEITSCLAWRDLDAVVWRRCPDLERVQIFFQLDSTRMMINSTPYLQAAMRLCLSGLNERGILSIRIASIEKVRGDVWSTAGY